MRNRVRHAGRSAFVEPLIGQASAVNLKFLSAVRQTRVGTSNLKPHWNHKVAGAVDLKFLSFLPRARAGTSNLKNRTRIMTLLVSL
jgi:hypothetical protein